MNPNMDPQLDPFLAAERERETENEEYFLRGKIVAICEAALAEEMGVIVASRRLSSLGLRLLDSRDEDFAMFDGLASETDHLPVDRERRNWSVDSLEGKDREIVHVEAFYREDLEAACRKLIERFDIRFGG